MSNPWSCKNPRVLYTDECSTLVVMMCFPPRWLAMAAPIRAILLDSEPPEVNTISFSSTLRLFAIMLLASRIYRSASTPFVCLAAALP